MPHRIALSHASGLAAEAILEKLGAVGLDPEALVLLDDESRAGNRLPFAGAYLEVQDQDGCDLSDVALLAMPEADDRLEAGALAQGCLLVSHAITADSAPLLVSVDAEPEIAYTAASLRLVGAEAACLLPTLLALNDLSPLRQVNATLMRSAEFHGKAGIDELATQTISLLNAREAEARVYPQQIAFNLLPDRVEARVAQDLWHFLGNSSYSQTLQVFDAPVFYGFAAALQLRFADDIDLGAAGGCLQALDKVELKTGPVSLVSDCNQSFSCVISAVEQPPSQPSSLQFWILADPLRYGLANNYVNLIDFLLKSFL